MTESSSRIFTDFLVIGSGIAGLSFALKVANYGKVVILTKASEDESNTKYAQGGIAAVVYEPDSFEKHIADTLVCGDGLCDEKVVRKVITESTDRIKELVDWGTRFDITPNGDFHLAREGGHSEKRILHHKDQTGFEIERALLEQVKRHPNIELHDHFFAVDIITQHHLGIEVDKNTPDITCYGVYALNLRNGNIQTLLAKITLMASGGAGNVYLNTTNPTIATGDGIAMVYRAKGRVEGMEFVQFHPTSLYTSQHKRPSFLISEAVRGHGAVLKNQKGQEFMHKYDQRGSLAPRDIVARAIDTEMKIAGSEHVWLDAKSIGAEMLQHHFPAIYKQCLAEGIDMATDLIPVVPAAHYLCGGIKVDLNGQSSIRCLYAAGECSSTGLHGANRLASNSLLEAVVFAHYAAEHCRSLLSGIAFEERIPDWDDQGTNYPEEMVLITQNLKEVQQIMSNYVGIVRSNIRLQRALDRLNIIYRENEDLYSRTTLSKELCELRNIINIGYIIIRHAMKRTESRGLHYSIDYPPA